MTRIQRGAARKVMLLEFNEITWRIIDPLLKKGKLPALAEFIRRGTRGAPRAVEDSAHLDPWISWTTVYTGRPQSEHGVRFLEQPPETVCGPRIWEIAADAGKKIGVYGSIMSWPPRHDVRGFWVPSTFSPTTETHPTSLQPIQQLNLSATRAHTPLAGKSDRTNIVSQALALKRLGLRTSTIMKVLSFLVGSRLNPQRAWEKVSLQPILNFDFFDKLVREHQPDLSTFHTNHVAHYQHRYWRAMDGTGFHVQPTAEERRRFGKAIEHGYRVADDLLARLWRLADENTVVILASALGQQPYVVDDFKEGRQVVRIKDISQILDLCGLHGHCTPLSMMAPQWNLKVPDPVRRAHAQRVLSTAWYRSPHVKLFALETVGDTICFNLFQKNLKPLDLDATCVFPELEDRQFTLGMLCAVQDATPKEGYHEAAGVAVLCGAGVRRGAQLESCTNLDLAPTILHLLGLPVPPYMQGRVLDEAFDQSSTTTAVTRQIPTAAAVD